MTRFIGSKIKYTLPAILFLCVSHLGHASPLCTTFVQTLAGYAGRTCMVGNVTFTFPSLADDFYTFSNDPNNPPVPANDVDVTIVGTGLTPGAQVGFAFTPTITTPWIATDPDGSDCAPYGIPDGECYNEADLSINFSASTTNPRLNLNSTSLIVNPAITYYGCSPLDYYSIENCPNFNSDGGDNIGAGESVTGPAGGLGSIDITAIGNDSADSRFNGGTALNETDYFNPVSSASVTKDIFIQGFDTDSQTVLTSITETFTYTTLPEPGPFVLAGAGLALLFLLRRRRAVLGIFGGAMVLIAVSSTNASASPLCTTYNNDSLALIETLPACMIGDVTFTFNSNSFIINSQSGLRAGSAPSAAGIQVNVLPGQLGFQFSVNTPVALVNGNQKLSFTVDYTAESSKKDINGLFAMDTVTTVGDGTFTPGCTFPTAECSPAISYPPVAPPAGDCPKWVNPSSIPTVSCAELENASNAELTYIDYPTKTSLGVTDSHLATLIAAGAPVTVSATFDMYASGATGSNEAHLSIFDDGVTEIPEPLSLMLMGLGLVGMGLLGRRRRLGRS